MMRFRMPPEASLVALALRVQNLDRMRAFYEGLLGLREVGRRGEEVRLAPEGRRFQLTLVHSPSSPLHPLGAVGLYHFALLLPDRASLARVVRRLLLANWPFEGASDHGVSEAFYLADPEGNGVELYRDRPPASWPRRDGEIVMVTRPLDVPGLLQEAREAGPLDPGTRLGHVHLRVDDLSRGEAFYAEILGLQVTQRGYPGALFLAAGGYHHHVGLNVWGPRRWPPEGATGLLSYTWWVPPEALAALEIWLRAREVPYGTRDGDLVLVDPARVEVNLTAQRPEAR
ncbi:MAG: VOC family protein [Armatimonadetes bacterium]|nr:VOC family protein [Armatimonadota bacterium]MDW8154093.1 VOC family protein [Armatimonadota bacterium]